MFGVLVLLFFYGHHYMVSSEIFIVDNKIHFEGIRKGSLEKPFEKIGDCIKVLKNAGIYKHIH